MDCAVSVCPAVQSGPYGKVKVMKHEWRLMTFVVHLKDGSRGISSGVCHVCSMDSVCN